MVLYRTQITRSALDDSSIDRLAPWSLSRRMRHVGYVMVVVDNGGVTETVEEASAQLHPPGTEWDFPGDLARGGVFTHADDGGLL